jgi:hypothetical protein
MKKNKPLIKAKKLTLEDLAWAMFEKVTFLEAQEFAYELGYEIVIVWKED